MDKIDADRIKKLFNKAFLPTEIPARFTTEKIQKIIFDMPGEETAPDIISDIMESNGFKGVTEDLIFSTETPKLVTVHNAIKDFFDKKISEEKFRGVATERGISKSCRLAM